MDLSILIDKFRWQDLVDILILSVIIYKFILMLQGTRTVQIMIGFLFVSISFYLADFLEFEGVYWVLNNVFASIVLVIIVLFQADFRNALAQVGTRTGFSDHRNQKPSGYIDQIFKVCTHFSEVGIGALIVLEKEMGLGQYSRGATQMNAELSPQLLVAIFNVHSPLHDGAVIINKDKQVACAGCILPLSTTIDLSKNYGTRHRAALGLCEETDAVVLVVSEETGVISLAHNGVLFHHTKECSIEKKLADLFTSSQKSIIKKNLFHV